LIETIVVLVILGLALTVVATFLPRRNTTLELESASSRVVGAMRIARWRAIAESRPVSFAMTPDGHGFRLDNGRIDLGPSVWLATPNGRPILFGPAGDASGGTLLVRMANKTRLIRVDRLTGRITFAEAS
jgi:general secretion pathway protein H